MNSFASKPRSEDAAISAMAFFQSNQDEFATAANSELQEEKSKIQDSLTALLAQEQIGIQLSKQYAAYLGKK